LSFATSLIIKKPDSTAPPPGRSIIYLSSHSRKITWREL
jgi:hypothetical protein